MGTSTLTPYHLPSAGCWELCDQELLSEGGREKKRREGGGAG